MLQSILIKIFRLIIGTVFAPLFAITCRKGYKFNLCKSIHTRTMYFEGGKETFSIPNLFGGMLFIGNEFINNNGVIYHELGHCRCWSAINGKHGNVHAHFLPAESELAADAYAVAHGYGDQLIAALESVNSRLGHRDNEIRIKVAREQMGLN